MQRYFDKPGPNHVVEQAIVITAKHAGHATVVAAIQEKYSWFPQAIRCLVVNEDELIIVSSDSFRPQPIVDYVLQAADTVVNGSAGG